MIMPFVIPNSAHGQRRHSVASVNLTSEGGRDGMGMPHAPENVSQCVMGSLPIFPLLLIVFWVEYQ